MPKFYIDYTFSARASAIRYADSKEALEAILESEVNDDGFELDPDEIDYIDFRVTEMHPVTRDGKEIWTTYVKQTDRRGHQSAIDNSPLFAGASA